MRLYAAGPSINIIATYVILILLSATATGLVAGNPGVHASGIIADEAAEEAGLLPYEIITHIDGNEVLGYETFSNEMAELSVGDQATFTVLSHPDHEGERVERDLIVTLGNRYQYHLGQCDGDAVCIEDIEVLLADLGIEPGDAFLGVSGLRSGSSSVDYYSNIMSGEFSLEQTILATSLTPLAMIGVPIQFDGQTMLLEERSMLEAGDGAIASVLGTDGMLMLFDFLFWLVWINFLLGFANLIPMVPFDGGHIVRDGTHSVLARLNRNMHPMRVESLADRISSMSSILVLIIVAVPIILPRLMG